MQIKWGRRSRNNMGFGKKFCCSLNLSKMEIFCSIFFHSLKFSRSCFSFFSLVFKFAHFNSRFIGIGDGLDGRKMEWDVGIDLNESIIFWECAPIWLTTASHTITTTQSLYYALQRISTLLTLIKWLNGCIVVVNFTNFPPFVNLIKIFRYTFMTSGKIWVNLIKIERSMNSGHVENWNIFDLLCSFKLFDAIFTSLRSKLQSNLLSVKSNHLAHKFKSHNSNSEVVAIALGDNQT